MKQKLSNGNIRSYVIIEQYRTCFYGNLQFTEVVWKQSKSKHKKDIFNQTLQPSMI